MSLRTVAAYAIGCDARGCKVSTAAHPTEHDAFIRWHLDFDGVHFLAGHYGAGIEEPAEYRCGKHWHISDSGYYMKGSRHVTQKAA